VRIRPAELGWKGLALVVALSLAFFATSYSNLFFLLLAFCAVLGGLGAAWALQNLRGIEVLRIDIAAGAAATERPVKVQLRTRRPRFAVEVVLRQGRRSLPLGQIDALVDAVVWQGRLPATPRGIDSWQVWLASRFPFGLFAARVATPHRVEIVTYPAPKAATADTGGSASPRDEGMARCGGADAQVAGLRQFRAGDSPRDVHWKATARRGAPVVVERERSGALPRNVVIDRRSDALEAELAIAAAAVLTSGKQPVRLRSQGLDVRCDGAADRQAAALRWLAAAGPLPRDEAAPLAMPGAGRSGGGG
jgi:uncharacterized protein (DUF58 family)